ncbi:hypothetical protein [Lentzea aerocolonigenes]|uniref:hypothetical protein n=1 Tax=Lentzea aerocolonigenes TaxID=68170 RepID=UPI0004C2FD7F|nr:hypothetical protein [Lentzea aerocolonigenes]
MKGCLYCWTQAELDVLDGDPALVPHDTVRRFAEEATGHFDPDEYELAWRRLAHRVIEILETSRTPCAPRDWSRRGSRAGRRTSASRCGR